MEILSIGNSFSQDATRYLHRIARADGVRLNTTNLCIGGCPLERHHRNMLSGGRVYELESNGEKTGFFVSLEEALCSRKWDVVTLQQYSGHSGDPETYRPYIFDLADMIREYAPKAKLLLHETWFYKEGCETLLSVAKFSTSAEMLSAVQKAYKEIASQIGADGIIPSGTLLGKLLEEGIPAIHRDDAHVSFGLGRYALGLLWYRVLTGNSVGENAFADPDEPISPEAYAVAKKCVDSIAAG